MRDGKTNASVASLFYKRRFPRWERIVPMVFGIGSALGHRPNLSQPGASPQVLLCMPTRAESPSYSVDGSMERAYSPHSSFLSDLGRCPRLE